MDFKDCPSHFAGPEAKKEPKHYSTTLAAACRCSFVHSSQGAKCSLLLLLLRLAAL